MGRYAFFNTDFEYKFWFAIQPSEDITWFGGEAEPAEDDPEEPRHVWTQENRLDVLDNLMILVKAFDFNLPDWTAFEKSVDGTSDLYRSIPTQGFPEKPLARFCLGCVIYHQLLYVEGGVLEARYEP